MGKYCLPDLSQTNHTSILNFTQQFYQTYDIDKYTNYIADIYKSWQVLAISVGVAFGASILYLLILRCCAGVMIWMSILGILGALGAGGYWVYLYRTHYITGDANYNYLTYGAYTLWGIAGAFAVVVLYMCSRIRLAVAIMKVAS